MLALKQHLPIAKVVLDLSLPHLDYPFDYEIPMEFDESCQPGVKVKVKFAGRNLEGWVVERRKSQLESKKLSKIDKVISELPVLKSDIVEICRITSDQFIGTLNDCLRFSVPPRQAKIEKKYKSSSFKQIKNNDFSLDNFEKKVNFIEFPPNYDYYQYLLESITKVKQQKRQTIVIFPNYSDVTNFIEFLNLENINSQVLSAEQEPSQRYEAFLNILTTSVDVVVGTRNAVFAPVHNLGLIILWDEFEENYYSQQAPYWNVREVCLTRSQLNDSYLLLTGFGKSLKSFMDIKNNLIQEISIPEKEDFWPELILNISDDPLEKIKMIPTTAWKMIQDGLKISNVLVQVPRLGYSSNLQCLDCRESLRCNFCSGPLHKSEKNESLQCKWCSKAVTFWQCQYCKSTRHTTSVSGQKKIVEEIGKSFPGVKIVTSGGKNILRKIRNEKCIVVATPGAEPISEDQYSALIVIDAYLYLAKSGLSSNEDTFRKWINAISLVKKHSQNGKVFINLDTQNRIIQSLIKKTSNWHLELEYRIRQETNLFPINNTYVITGNLNEINELMEEISKIQNLIILGPNIDEKNNESRLVVLTNDKILFPSMLRAIINRFSLKKRNPVRVKYNPYDIE